MQGESLEPAANPKRSWTSSASHRAAPRCASCLPPKRPRSAAPRQNQQSASVPRRIKDSPDKLFLLMDFSSLQQYPFFRGLFYKNFPLELLT